MRTGAPVAQLTPAVMVLALDVLTKALAVGLIPADRAVTVIADGVTLVVERNAGAALSIGQGHAWVFTVMLFAVIGALLWCGRRFDAGPVAVGAGLLLGGALGNLCDRVFRAPGPLTGHVVDFLAIGDWPVFNIADVGITCGVAILAWQSVFPARRAAPRGPLSDAPQTTWSWVAR